MEVYFKQIHLFHPGKLFLEINLTIHSLRISKNPLIYDISSAVSKEGQNAPRSGFFHNFRTKEVLVKKYNLEQETFEDVHDEVTIHRLQSNLKNLDRNLGAYPYDSWKKWVSLSNKISIETIQR